MEAFNICRLSADEATVGGSGIRGGLRHGRSEDGRALADQIAVTVQPESHKWVGFENFGPYRFGFQAGVIGLVEKAQDRHDPGILSGRVG
jgi:hypothetical protein